jgi:hypothetical protein
MAHVLLVLHKQHKVIQFLKTCNTLQKFIHVFLTCCSVSPKHYKARSHVSSWTTADFHRLWFIVFIHPPNSPDFAQSDFHVFSNMKERLRWHHFLSCNEVKTARRCRFFVFCYEGVAKTARSVRNTEMIMFRSNRVSSQDKIQQKFIAVSMKYLFTLREITGRYYSSVLLCIAGKSVHLNFLSCASSL